MFFRSTPDIKSHSNARIKLATAAEQKFSEPQRAMPSILTLSAHATTYRSINLANACGYTARFDPAENSE